MDIDYYSDSIPNFYGGVSPFGNNYKGELIRGLEQLYDIPISRFKISGYTKPMYIEYKIFSSSQVSKLEEMAITEIAKMCNFSVRDINDTCIIWKIIVVDSAKLNPFSWEKDSPNGDFWCNIINDMKDRDFFGQTFTAMARWFELDSRKHIFETDSDDTQDEPKRYKFLIPIQVIKDIDLLKPFMLEKYGIDLVPKMSVVKKKYIEFHKGD